MTCGNGGDPGKVEDESGNTKLERPDGAQKSNLVSPWQKGDEETSQKAGNSGNRDNVTTGVRDASRELKLLLV